MMGDEIHNSRRHKQIKSQKGHIEYIHECGLRNRARNQLLRAGYYLYKPEEYYEWSTVPLDIDRIKADIKSGRILEIRNFNKVLLDEVKEWLKKNGQDKEMIQVFSPTLGQDELSAIADSFNAGWIGKGPKVAEFERAWARHIGVNPENVVSVNCATEGLFQICELIQERSEFYRDEVIIPSIHFIGAANAVISSGAIPAYCDVDERTLNPTLDHIQAKYNRHTRAVILLHYGGVAQELDAIREWCDQKGLFLIEDAACAPATVYKGKAAGTWGHFGIWSFDAMKIMSTGDGGIVYCENPAHAKELRKRLYLGMTQESGLSSQGERWWEFEVNGLGRRAVMNDMAAGIGLEQLKNLKKFVTRRAFIWYRYAELLSENNAYDVSFIPYRYEQDSFYFCWIQTPRRDDLAKFLRSQEIYCTFRYYPLHRVFKTGDDLPGAEYAADNTLLLPLHCNLTDEQVGYICEKVKEFFND